MHCTSGFLSLQRQHTELMLAAQKNFTWSLLEYLSDQLHMWPTIVSGILVIRHRSMQIRARVQVRRINALFYANDFCPTSLHLEGIPFHAKDFIKSSLVSFFMRELGRHESGHNLSSQLTSDNPSTKAQYVQIIVFNALVS